MGLLISSPYSMVRLRRRLSGLIVLYSPLDKIPGAFNKQLFRRYLSAADTLPLTVVEESVNDMPIFLQAVWKGIPVEDFPFFVESMIFPRHHETWNRSLPLFSPLFSPVKKVEKFFRELGKRLCQGFAHRQHMHDGENPGFFEIPDFDILIVLE